MSLKYHDIANIIYSTQSSKLILRKYLASAQSILIFWSKVECVHWQKVFEKLWLKHMLSDLTKIKRIQSQIWLGSHTKHEDQPYIYKYSKIKKCS